MDFKLPDYSQFLPEIPILPDKDEMRLNGAMENLEHSKVIHDIEDILFQIKLKELEKENCSKKLSALNKSIDEKVGIWIFIIVSLISIIIPFIVASFNNYLDSCYLAIKMYMILSFIVSFAVLVGYMIYVYRK